MRPLLALLLATLTALAATPSRPNVVLILADDLTGATDVALMLAREGMRVITAKLVDCYRAEVARMRA